MKRLPLFLFPLLVLLAGWEGGCRKAPPPPPPPPVAVSVTAAVTESVPRRLTMIASVQAFASVDLVARIKGYLVERNFRDGTFVKKGDLLYRIEPYPYEAAVKVARGNLGVAISTRKNADITMKRQKELVERQATSVQDYDNALASKIEADANVETMQGQLEQAELNLVYTRITAPFDGWMGLNRYDAGNLVGPDSGVLATIVDQSRVLVQFSPADADLRGLGEHLASKEQFAKLEVRLFFESGETFPEAGTIVRYDNRIDPSTATVTLQAIFHNPEGKLTPGQFVTIELRTQKAEKLLLVPRSAILSDQTGEYLWAAGEDQKAQRRNLVVTQEFDHFVAVSQGIREGDKIILDNLTRIRAGMALALRDTPPSAAQLAALTGKGSAPPPAGEREDAYLRKSDTVGEGFRKTIQETSTDTERRLEREFYTPPVVGTDAKDPTDAPPPKK